MKTKTRIIGYSLGLAGIFWILDILIEKAMIPGSGWGELFINLNRPHDLVMRLSMLVVILGFGWLLGSIVEADRDRLTESEENLRTTLQSIGDAVIAADLEGKITRMNPVAESLTGWSMSEAQGEPLEKVFRIFNSYSRAAVENPVDLVLNTGRVVDLANHTLLLARDGSEYQIEDSAAPIMNETGSCQGVVLVFRDVTEKYHQRILLETTIHSLDYPFYVIDVDTYQIELANSAARQCSITGDLSTCYELTHRRFQPCSGQDHPCPLEQVRETGESVIMEHLHSGPLGEPRNMEVHAHPIFDFQGQVSKIIEYSMDVTERKIIEKELFETKEKYRKLVENSLQGMVIAQDDPVRLAYVSPAMEGITGYSVAELESFREQQIESLIYPEDRIRFFTSFQKRLIGEKLDPRAEYRIIASDGSTRWVELFSTRVEYLGSPAAQTVFLDITDRKEAERQLRDYSENLEEMVEQRTQELRETQEAMIDQERLAGLGELAESVGQELRNPLAVIANSVYFLKHSLKSTSGKTAEHLAILEDEISQSKKIISNLLLFGREAAPELEEINPELNITRLLEQIEIPPDIDLKLSFDPELPDLKIDPVHFQQVLENLIMNACQAMTEGGEMFISAQEYADGVQIMVKDSGGGIKPEDQEKVFEPLYTTKPRSVGLGLAICRKLVDLNRGGIQLESQPGEFTCIKLTFPVEKKIKV